MPTQSCRDQPKMPPRSAQSGGRVAGVSVRYWAAARSAAGVAAEQVPLTGATALSDLVARLSADRAALAAVLATCSVIVDSLPVSSVDPANVVLNSGATVEFLPPFAGG